MDVAVTPALAPILPKVSKLLALLGSPVDGEVLATVHALRRTLATANLSMTDFAVQITGVEPPANDDEELRHWLDLIGQCRSRPDLLLGDREREFLNKVEIWVRTRRRAPSPLQSKWLCDIARRAA